MESRKIGTAAPLRPGERRRLAELAKDPDYLAVKESLGEPLSAEERETLRAWREVVRALDGADGAGGPP